MPDQNSPQPLPVFFVGKQTTLTRIQDYQEQKHNLLSQSLGKPDTKSVWYSKEHIIKLLEEMESAGGDGLRISLGMYEPTHEYSGQLCLLMNVTREVVVGDSVSHQTVWLEDEADFASRNALPRNAPFQSNSPFLKNRDFNFGSPCPPRCD